MRIYVAAPWSCKAFAQSAAEKFEAAGHTITKKWWEHGEVPTYLTDDDSADDELAIQASEDLAGIMDADLFVLLNIEPSESKCVETGLALAFGTPIIIVGRRSNLFHYLPDIPTVPDLAAALNWIALCVP